MYHWCAVSPRFHLSRVSLLLLCGGYSFSSLLVVGLYILCSRAPSGLSQLNFKHM